MTATTCGALKANGELCSCAVGLCSECGRCFAHCPHREQERAEARSRGGRITSVKKRARLEGSKAVAYVPPDPSTVPAPPQTAADAREYLSWILDTAARGNLGGALARDLSTVAERFIKAIAASDLEARLARLEALEAKRKTGGNGDGRT